MGGLTDTLNNCSNKEHQQSLAGKALEEVPCDYLLLLLSLTLFFFYSNSKLRILLSFSMQPFFPCLEIRTFRIKTTLFFSVLTSSVFFSFSLYFLIDRHSLWLIKFSNFS